MCNAVQFRPWPPHFKGFSGVASCPPSPLSVRCFSARSGSVPGYDDGEGLKLELPLAQSAFSPLLSAAWLKNRSQHCPGRSHAILAQITPTFRSCSRSSWPIRLSAEAVERCQRFSERSRLEVLLHEQRAQYLAWIGTPRHVRDLSACGQV